MKSKNTLRWLYAIPGKKRGYIAVIALIQAVTSSAGVLFALFLRNIVDSAVEKQATSFWENVIALIMLELILLGMDAILDWMYERTQTDIENLFKKRLFDTILRKDYASVNEIHSGEWMTRLTSDVSLVASSYVELLPGLVGTAIRLICAMIMIITLERWFLVILVPGGFLLLVFTWLFRSRLKKLHKAVQESDGRLRSYLQERLSGLMMIKAFAAEAPNSEGAWGKMQDHKSARLRRNRFSIICKNGFAGAMEGMYVTGIVYCAYGILSGSVTYGTLTAIMQLIGQVQQPFANLSGFVSRFTAMSASAERLMDAESYPDDCPEGVLKSSEVQAYYREQFHSIILHNVDLAYPIPENTDEIHYDKVPNVLKGLNLTIHKGEYIAFTGHSGCGKSTVLKLLMCLYKQDAGKRILLGKDGEVPLTSKWRRLFAYVPQGNVLLSGKLRDVVAFAYPEQSGNDEKLMHALKIACVDEFLPELENGVDTVLGEHGTGLSEGQTQRIAIARAIFADLPVLLLDESTSALDEATEARLLKNLRAMSDKTVVIVTHRKAALSICDRVVKFTESGIEEAWTKQL